MVITKKLIAEHQKLFIGIIIPLCALIAVYFGMVIYFTDHFYFGSEINSTAVPCESVEEAKKQMTSKLQAYTLSLKERGGKSEEIRAAEIGLKYSSENEFKNFMDRQNPFNWVAAVFNTGGSKMAMDVSYDEKLLRESIDKLSCFDVSNIIEPKSPILKYSDTAYTVIDEVNGNRVDKSTLFGHVSNAILKRETQIDLESIGCYVKPQYTSKSPKVSETRDLLNKYVSSKITYTFGEHNAVLDGSIINKWLKVDDNFQITLDEVEEKKYLDVLSNNYSKIGRLKGFVTSSGTTIDVSGGDYKCLINASQEVQELNNLIRDGKTVTKEPAYVLNTYVEINLTQQHLWFYKNGSLIVEGDIVSGNAGGNLATPGGIYKLKAVVRNAILRGPGYAAPVSFWMPFNGGIGIHDATWRHSFGGNIYRGNGSHGCINCPYSLAETIFNNIETGTPVICYY